MRDLGLRGNCVHAQMGLRDAHLSGVGGVAAPVRTRPATVRPPPTRHSFREQRPGSQRCTRLRALRLPSIGECRFEASRFNNVGPYRVTFLCALASARGLARARRRGKRGLWCGLWCGWSRLKGRAGGPVGEIGADFRFGVRGPRPVGRGTARTHWYASCFALFVWDVHLTGVASVRAGAIFPHSGGIA